MFVFLTDGAFLRACTLILYRHACLSLSTNQIFFIPHLFRKYLPFYHFLIYRMVWLSGFIVILSHHIQV